MDPEQTFLRVHARLSGVLARLLTPKFRAVLEYLCLFNAVMLLALLVVIHVNFVAQPGCSAEFSGSDVADAQLIQIKITGSWNAVGNGPSFVSHGKFDGKASLSEHNVDEKAARNSPSQVPQVWDDGSNVLAPKFWLNLIHANVRRSRSAKHLSWVDSDPHSTAYVSAGDTETTSTNQKRTSKHSLAPDVISRSIKAGPGRGPLGTATLHYLARWSSYIAVCLKRGEQTLRSFWQVWRITGWEPFTASPKGDRRNAAWSQLDSVLVDGSKRGRKVLDPTYLYSVEKGYLMLSESAKAQHNIKSVNVTISAQNACFGNRWQQLLIDNFVGYDTILMNSLLHAREKGYLYNFQTKELYNLNYLEEFRGLPNGIEDYVVFKCGVLITSLFVFFTATMSVSFTLRETQARMLKFTVQLQHHARHRLPTFRLIFVHVVESLVFVPIMIGILFFLFEFFDDQLLAFMVLTLVWLCELYTMISVRTPLSIRYFPRFFFLYFMVFHIYFFSYTYGFSYLAFSATGAFMQHLVLYFWNRFEVPALQDFLRRAAYHHQQGVHISSAIFRVSTRVTSSNSPVLNDGHARRIPVHSVSHQRAQSYPNYLTDDAYRHLVGTEVNAGETPPSDDGNIFPRHLQRGLSMDNSSGNSLNRSRSQNDSGGRNSSLVDSSPDMASDDIDHGRHRAPRNDVEGVTSTLGDIYRASAQVVQASAPPSSVQQPSSGGTLTALGSVLPWILGNGPSTVVSLFPIFRDFREDRQSFSGSTPVTPDRTEGTAFSPGMSSGTRVRRRYIPAYLPTTR